jgi:hypothetical protein
VLTHWDARTLDDLLRTHGLDGVEEEPFPNDGWSGATLTLLRRGDERFVLKRTSWAVDWIARATRDHALREGFVAANGVLADGPVIAPYLGAAVDGTTLALLMPDLSSRLIPWERPADAPGVERPVVARVLGAMAALHSRSWVPDPEAWPWCPLRERLTLLARPSAERFRADGVAVGARFLAGWDAFEERATGEARELVESLADDPAPLLAALARLPAVDLHGDLKLANVALFGDGRVGLIDWQMTCHAPVAVELGWFLVSNAPILPDPPDATLARYAEAMAAAGRNGAIGDWDAQVDLAWIVGLVLRGWRKGLDSVAGLTLASGVSAAEDLATWCSRAVEAAQRRLWATGPKRPPGP